MKIMMTIHNEEVQKIISGKKRFLYRRGHNACSMEVDTMIIYIPDPFRVICGEIEIIDIKKGTPAEIWEFTRRFGADSHNYFKGYFEGEDVAIAYQLGRYKNYNHSPTLGSFGLKRAPKVFTYVRKDDE